MFNTLAELGLNWLFMAAVDSLLAHDLDFRVFPTQTTTRLPRRRAMWSMRWGWPALHPNTSRTDSSHLDSFNPMHFV